MATMRRGQSKNSFSAFTTASFESVFQDLGCNPETGLTSEEITKRLKQHGENVLKVKEVRWWQILFRQFASPFIYLLIGAALISLFLNESVNAIMILIFVVLNAMLGFLQEFRSERALKLLSSYVVKLARVLRNGKEQMVETSQLVPGDIVLLEPGDHVPADLRIVDSGNLNIDESILTGESVPTGKIATPLEKEVSEPHQAENIAFCSTSVVSGQGRGLVIATGRKTVIGSIAQLTVETVRTSTFSKGIARFSRFILNLIVLTLIFIFVANIFIKGAGVDIPEFLIFTIALAVSVIPEALPVVTTFSLSKGALHLAKRHVVVKRLSAIEDLGSIEVLCTDKTGTLTENVLTVDSSYPSGDSQILFYARLAAPFLKEDLQLPNNAFDLALHKQLSASEQNAIAEYQRIKEIPFDPNYRRNSVLVKKDEHCQYIVRGAPEDVLKICQTLPADKKQEVEHWIDDAGNAGKRVIAVASRVVEGKIPENISGLEHDLQFVGLISFIDPLKKTTLEAVKRAEKLGVRIKILTGDSKAVAGTVAHQIGLIDSPTKVISGESLDKLPVAKRWKMIDEGVVFARVTPQQKYAIIKQLQKKYEVGFLGEGINDAPALKIANVAIVVRGAADIAQEAADIVLLQKSLHVIIDGIQEGRKVFANTVKYIKSTLSSNFGNFYAVAIASLLIDTLPMLPLQILLLNLLSDFPMISISTDTVDAQELKSPKTYNVREIALIATILGVVSSVFDFLVFALYYRAPSGVLQTNWFIASIVTELVFLFSIRTHLPFYKAQRPSGTVIVLTGVAFLLTLVLPYTTLGQTIFFFKPPSSIQLTTILGIAVLYFSISESVKLLYYRFTNHSL